MTVAEIANATNPVAAKLRRANRRRSAMGAAAMRSSYITKAAKVTAAAASRATIAGLAQPSALPRISANISAVSAPAIRTVPGQSARPAGRVAGFAQPGRPARERRHADGQVDEEDRPPPEGVGQHPAGQRPDGAGGAERGAEDAQRPGQGGAGELRAQQRRAGGEQHRAADPLQRAEQLQRQRRRRQRARQRPGGEDDQPGQEQPARPSRSPRVAAGSSSTASTRA